ncbi:Zinc finger C2HC domain-containing protein 1C [Histomonas meleagridis]|nr:Zinc finger C2HC domain-containing protein 1C [Histomonas meleagridis]
MDKNFMSWDAHDVSNNLSSNGYDYASDIFLDNDITGDLLPMIKEEHLKDMGILSIGKRLLLLQYIQNLTNQSTQKPKFSQIEQSPARSRPTPLEQTTPRNRSSQEQSTTKARSAQLEQSTPRSRSSQQEQSFDRTKSVSSRSSTKRVQTASSQKSTDDVPKWQKDHDKMVESIRAARKYAAYQKAVEEGRNVGPPPELPPIEEPPGLVACPHCGRKMSEDALKHHVTGCERMNSRKNATRRGR